MLVPNEIQIRYKSIKKKSIPPLTFRTVPDPKNPGNEQYLVADRESIVIFSGRTGEQKTVIDLRYEEIGKVDMTSESPYVYLELQAKNGDMRFKFVMTDLARLTRLVGLWNERSVEATDKLLNLGRRTSTLHVHTEVIEYSPMIGFAAALYAMVECDGEAPPVELATLRLVIPDSTLRRLGRRYLKKCGVEKVIRQLTKSLSEDGKQCLIANLIEVAMADAVFRSKERELLELVCDAFEIDMDVYDAIFGVLLVKHNTDVVMETLPSDHCHTES